MRTDDQKDQTTQHATSQNTGLNFETPELEPLARLARATEEILPTIRQGERVPPHLANAVEEAHTAVVKRYPQIRQSGQQSGRATGGIGQSNR